MSVDDCVHICVEFVQPCIHDVERVIDFAVHDGNELLMQVVVPFQQILPQSHHPFFDAIDARGGFSELSGLVTQGILMLAQGAVYDREGLVISDSKKGRRGTG